MLILVMNLGGTEESIEGAMVLVLLRVDQG